MIPCAILIILLLPIVLIVLIVLIVDDSMSWSTTLPVFQVPLLVSNK